MGECVMRDIVKNEVENPVREIRYCVLRLTFFLIHAPSINLLSQPTQRILFLALQETLVQTLRRRKWGRNYQTSSKDQDCAAVDNCCNTDANANLAQAYSKLLA